MAKSQGHADDDLTHLKIRLRAWRAVLELEGTLTQIFDAELRDRAGIELQTYDALLHTFEAGEQGIRMTDLARHVVLSKSGLTAVVDRLEKRKWLKRVADPDDRRATRITLTAAGEKVFRRAAEVHLDGIEKHFSVHVSDQEAEVIARALNRVRAEAFSSE